MVMVMMMIMIGIAMMMLSDCALVTNTKAGPQRENLVALPQAMIIMTLLMIRIDDNDDDFTDDM